MTGQSVSIIITLVVGQERQEIHRSIKPERLEETIREFSQEIGQALLQTALDVLDESLRAEVPKAWRNVGTASRTVVFESGPVRYRRRVYQDEHGRRWKPLDLLLGIAPFARTSLKVQEMGCVLASRSTYRNASEMLAYVLRTAISPSSLQRMVKRFGELIEAYEQDWLAETEPGRIQTDTLYGESDGVWVHLQQQDQKRAEVKVGLLYSGKKCIGMGRYACENKVVMTQLGGSNEEWQIKVRELADRHFDLSEVKHLVVGGDGAPWVRHAFDLLNLPQMPVLDRFHVCRAVHRSLGKMLNSWSLLDRLFTTPFEQIKPELLALQAKVRGKQALEIQRVIRYLEHNQDALLDLDKRGLPDLKPATLGAAEGNVDKLVRQRMRGRGLSWSPSGGQSLLTILRHRDTLAKDAFMRPSAKPENQYIMTKGKTEVYKPISASIPLFRSVDNLQPWVQLLKNRMNKELSLTALF